MLHTGETGMHADTVSLGKAEGRMEKVFAYLQHNKLQIVYDYMQDFPPIESVGTARRKILTGRNV